MALKDVKQYYYNMQAQYLEMKADLEDFESALKAGHITEDQLQSVKDDIAKLEQNYQRLAYILFLFEQPNRKEKVAGFNKRNEGLTNYFTELKASEAEVKLENESVLNHIRQELKKLKEQ